MTGEGKLEALKPCPFCGGEAKIQSRGFETSRRKASQTRPDDASEGAEGVRTTPNPSGTRNVLR